MQIIISPAKKMNIDTDSLAPVKLPHFLEDARSFVRSFKKNELSGTKNPVVLQ